MSAYTPVPHCFLRERGKVPILLRPQCLHECALRYAAAATIFSRRYVFGPPSTPVSEIVKMKRPLLKVTCAGAVRLGAPSVRLFLVRLRPRRAELRFTGQNPEYQIKKSFAAA